MLSRLQIDRIEPFADGMAFGTVGSYVRLVGTAYGELEPHHPCNAVIVNLDKAPRNSRGCVEYAADVYIMRPTEVTKGTVSSCMRSTIEAANDSCPFSMRRPRPRRPLPMTLPR